MGKKKVEFEPVVMYDEDGYVSITLNEYKELLITKGKYEELKRQEDKPSIQYIPNIQPLTYPNDLTPKVTFGEVSTATTLKGGKTQ